MDASLKTIQTLSMYRLSKTISIITIDHNIF